MFGFHRHGYHVDTNTHSRRLDLPRSKVWEALMDWDAWFPEKLRTGGMATPLVVERKLGGLIYEDYGDGQGLVWYRVITMRRGEELELAGELTPRFGGPGQSYATWLLTDDGDGTKLEYTTSYAGALSLKINLGNEILGPQWLGLVCDRANGKLPPGRGSG